jgi:hypothetical protein
MLNSSEKLKPRNVNFIRQIIEGNFQLNERIMTGEKVFDWQQIETDVASQMERAARDDFYFGVWMSEIVSRAFSKKILIKNRIF